MATRELKATVFYNAGELTYNFPFDYIKKMFVAIKYIDNFEADTLDAAKNLEYGVDYTINDKVVTLKEVGDTSKYIYIYRSTPTEPIVDFSNSSFLTEENLDLSSLQQLHLNEEMSDYLILHKVPSGTLTEIRDAVESANNAADNAQQSAEEALNASEVAISNAHSINIRTFNSVEEMKASNTLKAGALAKTLGFYTAGDGGGADYVIVDDIGENEADEASIITLQNGLYAKLLIQDYINVKWFGAKSDGETDDTEAIQKALDTGKCVTLTKGIYKINGNISNGTLIVNNGLIAGTPTFYNIEIVAPLKQIFKNDTVANGTLKNSDIFPQWWGGYPSQININDNDGEQNSIDTVALSATDGANAIQKAIEFAGTNNIKNIGRPTIRLTKGLWRIDSPVVLDTPTIVPNLQGVGINQTILYFKNLPENSYAISISGGVGGNSNKGDFGDFCLIGNDTTILLGFIGCVGYQFRRTRFSKCKLAVHFYNRDKSTFTEQCKIIDSWFDWHCGQKVKFEKGEGDGSFHGCGLRHCYAEQYLDSNYFMEIGTGASPYNAELDVNLMLHGDTKPVIYLHSNAWRPNFKGAIQIEGATENTVLCDGEDNSTALFFMGSISSWAQGLNLGKLFLCKTYSSRASYPYEMVQFEPRHYSVPLDKKRSFGLGEESNGSMFLIDVFKAGYAYKGLIYILSEYNAGLAEQTTFKLIDSILTEGEKPTFGQEKTSRLTITPPDGITGLTCNVTIFPLGFNRRYQFIGSKNDEDLA